MPVCCIVSLLKLQSHLYGIEIYIRPHAVVIVFSLQSHLYGIEILCQLLPYLHVHNSNRTFMELKYWDKAICGFTFFTPIAPLWN